MFGAGSILFNLGLKNDTKKVFDQVTRDADKLKSKLDGLKIDANGRMRDARGRFVGSGGGGGLLGGAKGFLGLGAGGGLMAGLTGLNPMVAAAVGAFKVIGGAVMDFSNKIESVTEKWEKYRTVMNTALGDSKLGGMAVDANMRKASELPVSADEQMQAYIKLNGAGVRTDDKTFNALADMAGSQGKGYLQAVEALLDARNGEYERLKEAFNMKATTKGDMVSFRMGGKTMTATKGDENAITQAILSFGQNKGIKGMSANMMQTLEGVKSNAGDQEEMTFKKLGESGFNNLFKSWYTLKGEVFGGINTALDMLTTNGGKLKAVFEPITNVFMSIWNGVKGIFDQFKGGSGAMSFFDGVMTNIKDVLQEMKPSLDQLTAGIKVFFGYLKSAFKVTWAVFGGIATVLFPIIKRVFTLVFSMVTNTLGSLLKVFGGLGKALVGLVTFDPKAVRQGVSDAWSGIKGGITGTLGNWANFFTTDYKQGYKSDKAAENKSTLTDLANMLDKKNGKSSGKDKDGKNLSTTGTTLHGQRPTNITIAIRSLIESQSIVVSSAREGGQRTGNTVVDELLKVIYNSSRMGGASAQ